MDRNKTSSGTGPSKAPVPQVDKEHFADMRRLERDPNHINGKFKDTARGPVRGEK